MQIYGDQDKGGFEMIAVVQRVLQSSVVIDGSLCSQIEKGVNILIGFEKGDTVENINKMAKKCSELRIFEDENGKMSKSLIDIKGEMLIVSQFTLAGDVSKGRRPDFTSAMHPDLAKEYYEQFIYECKKIVGEDKVKSGVFAADMKVSILNDGPVTIIIKL